MTPEELKDFMLELSKDKSLEIDFNKDGTYDVWHKVHPLGEEYVPEGISIIHDKVPKIVFGRDANDPDLLSEILELTVQERMDAGPFDYFGYSMNKNAILRALDWQTNVTHPSRKRRYEKVIELREEK